VFVRHTTGVSQPGGPEGADVTNWSADCDHRTAHPAWMSLCRRSKTPVTQLRFTRRYFKHPKKQNGVRLRKPEWPVADLRRGQKATDLPNW